MSDTEINEHDDIYYVTEYDNYKPDYDKVVTVAYEKDDLPTHRKKMTLREALKEIDNSKQYTFCKKCNHDIDNHETVEDYKVRFAGACEDCNCDQYLPGRVVTQKELDEEAKQKSL